MWVPFYMGIARRVSVRSSPSDLGPILAVTDTYSCPRSDTKDIV
jgi:hypothetical protein